MPCSVIHSCGKCLVLSVRRMSASAERAAARTWRSGVHLDGLSSGDVAWVNVDQGVLDEVVHQLFEALRCSLIESEPGAEVPRHLIEDLLAPVDLDGTGVGGVEEVVAQGP